MEGLVTAWWTLAGLMFTSGTLSLIQVWFFQKSLAPSQSPSPSGARVQGAILAAPGSEWEFKSPVWLHSPGSLLGKRPGRSMLERYVVAVTVLMQGVAPGD